MTTSAVNLDHLAAAVEGIVGAEHLRGGERAEGYAIGDIAPALVASPDTAEEVAALLRAADEVGAAVVPWGGGTQQTYGYPPARYDIALSLRRLNRLIAYAPEDLTIAVEAGMTLADLQTTVLDAREQMLPFDPPLADRLTLGGMLATHASGPRRHGYGTIRDFCIGLHAAYVDGTVAKAGGMVVKNVTGFDLMKMHLGALGTLGVVTRVNCKLIPKPADERTLVLQFDSSDAAFAFAAALLATSLNPTALEYCSPQTATDARAPLDGHLLCVRCAGSAASVVRQERDIRDALPAHHGREAATLAGDERARLWSSLADWNATAHLTPRTAVLKLSAIPTDLPAAVTETMAVGAQNGLEVAARASAGVGVAYFRVIGDAEAVGLRRTLETLHAHWPALVVLGCDPAHAHMLPMWGVAPPTLPVMRDLKRAYDPRNTLNPGRYIGKI